MFVFTAISDVTLAVCPMCADWRSNSLDVQTVMLSQLLDSRSSYIRADPRTGAVEEGLGETISASAAFPVMMSHVSYYGIGATFSWNLQEWRALFDSHLDCLVLESWRVFFRFADWDGVWLQHTGTYR